MADSSTTYETLECLFNNIKEDFIFMNLRVTSPLRKVEHLEEAIKMFKDCDHIVSFSELKYSKSLLNDGYLLPSRHGEDYKNNYLRDKTFYTQKTKVYEMEKIFSFDIDDEIDFYICEELYKNYILEN